MRNLFFLAALSLLFACSSPKQTLRKADKAYTKLAYTDAIKHYENYLTNNRNDSAMLRLAHSYSKNQNPSAAVAWYEAYYSNQPSEPEAIYHYGNSLLNVSEYRKASFIFERLPDTGVYSYQKELGLASAELGLKKDENLNLYLIDSLECNSKYSDFSPVIYKDQVIFASNRPFKNQKRVIDPTYNQPLVSLFEAGIEDNLKDAKPVKFLEKIELNQGPVAFNSRDAVLIVSENHANLAPSSPNYHNLKLVQYRKAYGEKYYRLEQDLPFCNPNFNYSHPVYGEDGKRLWFASDQENGHGGSDIWYVNINADGTYSAPVNAGTHVNTSKDEVFPGINRDGKLVFSSDGWPGYGGLDLFVTGEYKDVQTFDSPINLGYGLNSSSDDFGLVYTDDSSGFFSSNRSEANQFDDIYSFEILSVKERKELDEKKEAELLARGKELKSVKVTVLRDTKDVSTHEESESASSESLSSSKKDEKSNKENEDSSLTQKDKNSVNQESEINQDDSFASNKQGNSNKDLTEQTESNEENNSTSSKDNSSADNSSSSSSDTDRSSTGSSNSSNTNSGSTISSDTKQTKYKVVSGIVLMDESKLPAKEAEVTFIEVRKRNQSTIYPDNNGFFETALKENTSYMVVLKRKGLPNDTNLISTSNLDASGELEPFYITGTGSSFNMVFRDIYFDFNRASLRPESKVEVENMYNILRRSPELRVEVSAHTDSRGSDDYNLALSNRRAKSVVDYLISKGIDKSRIIPKGYGESKLTNNCEDGVQCSKEEHQQNRRVEFTVIDKKNRLIQKSQK